MADVRISALPTASALAADDIFPLVKDPSGTPVTQKIAASVVRAFIRSGQFINARDPEYNAPNDGLSDASTAIQSAINAAITNRIPLWIPPGTYRLDSPLIIANAIHRSVIIVGAGRGFSIENSSSLNRPQTLFLVNYADKPGFVIQNCRSVYVSSLAIRGQNDAWDSITVPSRTQSDYVEAGCRDSRYSPYCGVAIDPCMGSAPPDGGYPGMSYDGNTGGSHDVILDNIAIARFVVGIMHSPHSVTTNADQALYRNVYVSRCAVGFAAGQGQSKNTVFQFGEIAFCRTAIDCVSYGQQQGWPPQMHQVQFGVLYQIFECNSAFGPMSLHQCFAESIKMIGRWGSGSSTSRSPLSITGGSYSIRTINGWGKLPPYAIEAHAPAVLSSVSVRDDTLFHKAWNFVGSNGMFTLDSCALVGTTSATRPPFVGYSSAFVGGSTQIRNCWIANQSGGGYILSDDPPRLFSLPARVDATQHTRTISTSSARYVYIPGGTGEDLVPNCSNFVVDTTAGTVTFSTPNAENVLLNDDILMWRTLEGGYSLTKFIIPALEVVSRSGTTVVCNMLWEHAYYDTTYAPSNMSLCVGEWAPGSALTGTVTNGSDQITAVSPTNILRAGDRIFGTVGIPAGTRVKSISGSTVTLNRNANASGTTTLYYGRLHTLTTTAAF